jgi:hypothetical protein
MVSWASSSGYPAQPVPFLHQNVGEIDHVKLIMFNLIAITTQRISFPLHL